MDLVLDANVLFAALIRSKKRKCGKEKVRILDKQQLIQSKKDLAAI